METTGHRLPATQRTREACGRRLSIIGSLPEELRHRGQHLVRWPDRQTGGRKGVEEHFSVLLADETTIRDHDDTAVVVGSDQPAEALAKLDHRLRKRIVRESASATRLDGFGSGEYDRVAWHAKG